MDIRKRIAKQIKQELKGTRHEKFNVIDIMAAIRLLEGKIYQQMINGNGVLVREIMMIYPDAATKVVYRKLRQEAKAKKNPQP